MIIIGLFFNIWFILLNGFMV